MIGGLNKISVYLKACTFICHLCLNWRVGGWIRPNPNVVWIAKSAQINGPSLTVHIEVIVPVYVTYSACYHAISGYSCGFPVVPHGVFAGDSTSQAHDNTIPATGHNVTSLVAFQIQVVIITVFFFCYTFRYVGVSSICLTL